MKQFSKTALIIGAGPAGLTAAYELLTNTDIKPVIIEATNEIGGISATHKYKGNRIDIGGHRFYSKDESILKWWMDFLPVQGKPSIDDILLKRDRSHLFDPKGNDPELIDQVMLVRPRLSRIFFHDNLFDYPLKPSFATFSKLGIGLTSQIGFDYLVNRLHPINPEKNLEDFFINRFGNKLYETFFKYYTEKVWGIPCKEISKEWGSQRVKGVSISELLRHALSKKNRNTDSVETSLISQFYYPKLGPGQLWEEVAKRIVHLGGEIFKNTCVKEINVSESIVKTVSVITNDKTTDFAPDYLFSSMPIKDLITAITPAVPADIRSVSDNLVYRDFIMTGILAKTMKQGTTGAAFPNVKLLTDTWIYIQENEMISGRLQIYNNWSPYMVANRNTVWIGLEFFCNEGDSFWKKTDSEIIALASKELTKMNLLSDSDILDGTCIRVKKAYPAYWGSYKQLGSVKNYLCDISNLFCIGRNGLHRYNNMDHSMLTAIASVNSLNDNSISKEDIWKINADDEYGEEK
jgi:protoporphyrinogen oxidase